MQRLPRMSDDVSGRQDGKWQEIACKQGDYQRKFQQRRYSAVLQ